MRAITHIAVHHSASSLKTTAADIDSWHRAKGWSGAGYHLICESTGKLVQGRPIGRVGAHVRSWNKNSIGICIVGDNTTDDQGWTQAQFYSLRQIYFVLCAMFPHAEWLGHRDFPGAATECPGLDVRKLLGIEIPDLT